MRRTAPFLGMMVLLLLHTQIAEAQFRTTNNSSTVEINSIDIAPTYPPQPTLLPHEPTPTSSTIKPVVIKNLPKKPVSPPVPKRFFSMGLTQDMVDFGIIDPTNPVVRTHTITLDRGNAASMSLFAYENRPLSSANGGFIPDTSCDDGSCTQILTGIWANTLTYGFGYRCDDASATAGICNPSFKDQQSYRQFADVTRNEASAPVLADGITNQVITTKLTYKLNVPGTQAPGRYDNALILIAAPTY